MRRIYQKNFSCMVLIRWFCVFLLLFKRSFSSHVHSADLLLRSLHSKEDGIRGKNRGSLLDFYHYFYDGEVKTYHPQLSKALRSNFGLSESFFRQCMNIRELECVSSDSKSGQTFWRSSDGTLVVKTIKGYECQTMRKLLVSYANHVTGNLSCLSGVLGLYRVHMKGKKTYFLITRCVFSKVAMPAMMPRRYYADLAPTDGAFIDRSSQEGSGLRYDLKGSTYGRQKSVSSSVLKDLDLMYSTSGSIGELGFAKPVLLDTLHRDCSFLAANCLMDYSLLVEVERSDVSHYHKRFPNRILDPVSCSMKDRGKLAVLGSDGRIYHFGIIDFLQRYTLRKWLETRIKGFYTDWKTISCVPPKYYSTRMMKFIDTYTS